MWLPGMNDMPPLATSTAAAEVPSNPPLPDLRPPSAEVIVLSRRVRKWRGMTAVVGSLAAALTALVVTREIRPDLLPEPVAAARDHRTVKWRHRRWPSSSRCFRRTMPRRRSSSPSTSTSASLSVRKVGAERQAGKSYELWMSAGVRHRAALARPCRRSGIHGAARARGLRRADAQQCDLRHLARAGRRFARPASRPGRSSTASCCRRRRRRSRKRRRDAPFV